MQFSVAAKRNIDTIVPLVGAMVALWITYKKKKDIKQASITAGILLLVLYVATTQATRLLVKASQKSSLLDIPPDAANTIAPNFDADHWVDQLHEDINCMFCWRNKQLYQDMAALNNAELALIYQAWQQKYFSEDNETLVQALSGEVLGWHDELAANTDSIMNRLKSMGYN